MPSLQTQNENHGSIVLEPLKLSLILSLFLLTLPSLFVSLITFSILAFFLLLPIATALFAIYLLTGILSRFPINSFEFDEICARKVDPIEDDKKQECIELDSSEIPMLDESSTSSSVEQEKIMKELVEMDCDEFCRLVERFGSVQSEGFMSFYEVLSFWRSKERLSGGKWHLDYGNILGPCVVHVR